MKKYLSYITSGIILILLGLLFVLAPNAVVKIGVIAFGVYNIVEAVTALVTSYKFKGMGGIIRFNMVKTLINLIISILVVYFAAIAPGTAVASWVVWLIALNLLFAGLSEVIESWMIKKNGFTELFYYGPSGWLYIVFALLMFIFPNFINSTLLLVLGVIVITSGVFVILWSIKLWSVMRSFNKEEKIAEAEWSEKK